MNLNTISADSAAGPQTPLPTRGGGESFQVAYAKVFDQRYSAIAQDAAPAHAVSAQRDPARVAQTARIVHAGDTLSSIVRERLASMGAAADGGIVRQGVAQLAQANNIRNPDRIYVGQKLDLAALDVASGRNEPIATGGFAAARMYEDLLSPDDGTHIASAHEISLPAHRQWDDSITAYAVEAAAAGPAQLPPATPASPLLLAIAEDDAAAKLTVAPMAAQLALYSQNVPGASEKQTEPARGMADILNKGVVGKVLDAMPLEPSTRTALQRASTIVSSTTAARSLGALAGLGGPLLTVAGLIWGIFSARQIDPAPAGDAKPADDTKAVADAK
jgi:LysM repeat protein